VQGTHEVGSIAGPDLVALDLQLQEGVPPVDLIEGTRLFSLAVLRFCRQLPPSDDWLEYLKDGQIRQDDTLLQEARELASILAAAVRTARKNSTNRSKSVQ
jgi:hypothetical protein